MNNTSVSYSDKENQEWIDNPFDLDVGFDGQGMTRMSHVRQLELYAEELVGRFAKYENEQYYLSLSSLPEHEQSELTRLFLESIDREMESEAIHGNDLSLNNDYLCALLSLLKDDSRETRENLAEITRKNITKYYEQSLQKTLDDACESFLFNNNHQQGLHCFQDQEHGDFRWGKI